MLPIRKLPIPEQIPFVQIVDQILAVTMTEDYLHNSEKQAKVEEFERQIDQLVFCAYGLTQEEIAAVEDNHVPDYLGEIERIL